MDASVAEGELISHIIFSLHVNDNAAPFHYV
jgi:hypothetical protein